MKGICIVVGLISFATLAACVQNVIFVVAVNDGQEPPNVTRTFLLNGTLDEVASTINVKNQIVYELHDYRAEANSDCNTAVKLFEEFLRKQTFVDYAYAAGTIGDLETGERVLGKLYGIRDPVIIRAVDPKGNYTYVFGYSK